MNTNQKKEKGNSFAFEIIQYIAKDNTKLFRIATLEGIAILILLAIIIFKVII